MKKNLLILGLACLLLCCNSKKVTDKNIVSPAFNRQTSSFLSLMLATDRPVQKHPALFPLAAIYTNSLPLSSNRQYHGIFSFLTSVVAHIGNPRFYRAQDDATTNLSATAINTKQLQDAGNNSGVWRIAAGVFMLVLAGILGVMALQTKTTTTYLHDTNRYPNSDRVNYKKR